jgi:hypothetical protein
MAVTITPDASAELPYTLLVRLSPSAFEDLEAQAAEADVPVGLVARSLIQSALHAQAQGRG